MVIENFVEPSHHCDIPVRDLERLHVDDQGFPVAQVEGREHVEVVRTTDIGTKLVGIGPNKGVGRVEKLGVHEAVQRGHDLKCAGRGPDPGRNFGIRVRLQCDPLGVVEHLDLVRCERFLFATADELAHEDRVRPLRSLDPGAGLGGFRPGEHQREISVGVQAERAFVAVVECPAATFAAGIESQAEVAEGARVAADAIAVLPVELDRVVLGVGVVAADLARGRVRPGPERCPGIAVADHLGGHREDPEQEPRSLGRFLGRSCVAQDDVELLADPRVQLPKRDDTRQ